MSRPMSKTDRSNMIAIHGIAQMLGQCQKTFSSLSVQGWARQGGQLSSVSALPPHRSMVALRASAAIQREMQSANEATPL